ncbi:MAG: glutamine amidotransferase family protein [Oscillospiraceae bacterium]|jgi:glutamate synthase domain-containing protein 1|nr:glutamine amidotransferase family protein [Oscillospiraceae bacterium]MDD3261530.1 glutamine amidotransferase family protein [Oscillospiraceae bacterium]
MQKEGQIHIPSGCAIAGIFCKDGRRVSGESMINSIRIMHDRSNGLGGGFAGYGIYPEHKDAYAFHVFYDSITAKEQVEDFLAHHFEIESLSKIPTRQTLGITDAPLIWRYFVYPLPRKLHDAQLDEREYVVRCVMNINAHIDGAYVFSSGKNMGVFKAVGYPEDVGRFYKLEEYAGYCWTAHGRYPTNTPGWWGGAHPFALLDYSIVHNGEISSYDANRRCIEMYGYSCNLMTDTEAITYIVDYLNRRQGLTLEEVANVIAAPFWSTIEAMPEPKRSQLTYLRNTFASLLITGPFSILLGFNGGLMALNDRLKLRSMVAAQKGETIYVASEESAIRRIQPSLDQIWSPMGGEPLIFRLNEGVEF